MSKFHLKGLDTYRAIAALIVLFQHIELFKNKRGYENILHFKFFTYTGGHIAVILFFALSGYLITMLLIREKDKYNSISLKKFYLRRILRVWPLFYLIIFLSYTILDYSPSTLTTLLCLSIFPNIAHSLSHGWAVSPQIWSVGVEEQFYLGWPIIIKKTNKFLLFLIVFFLFVSLLPFFVSFILEVLCSKKNIIEIVDYFFYWNKFNCMAAGGIFAVLYHKNSKIVKILNLNKYIAYFLIILPFILWFIGFHLKYFTDELYSILFAISILNISTNKEVLKIDLKIPNFMGKISYGLYMYHWIILEIIFRVGLPEIKNQLFFNIILYLIAVFCTIGISSLSYYLIEKPLLNYKDRYSRT